MTFMQKNGLMWTCVLDRLLLITMTLFEMLEYYYPLKLIFCYLGTFADIFIKFCKT